MTSRTNAQLSIGSAADPERNTTTFICGGDEVLKISDKGFWVNGKIVNDTAKGRRRVYEAFQSWLVYQRLTQKW